MRVSVYSRHDAFVGAIGGAALLSFVHTDELNGEDSVAISTTFRLREGYRLVWRDRDGQAHEHVCQDPQALHTDGRIVYTDTALNSVCELYGDYIEDKRPYSYSYQKALEVALAPTRWAVGTVDQPGAVAKGLTFYHVSAREALQSILECGGELETSITVGSGGVARRAIGIRAHRGTTSGHRRFSYGKDITSVSKTEHWSAITACYGYGKGVETDNGGYGRKLTFADINGGKAYVADSEALKAYGRPDGKGGKAHVFGKFEDSDCEDAKTLMQETHDYLDEHKVPGVTYEADVADLLAFGRSWEGVAVGDSVQIVDTDFSPALRAEGRVTKLVTDMLGDAQSVTLGNVTETMADLWAQQQRQLSSLGNRSSNWDVAATTPAAYLQQVIDGLNEQFNLLGNSYMFQSFEKGVILSSVPLDKQGNPTKTGGWAMQLCSQGFRIASGTKADGSFDWRTFGTGEGFAADYIITGTLMASLIKAGILSDSKGRNYWNMETGDFSLSSAATIGGKTASKIASDAVAAQTQTDIFNKLTNGGSTQGIYLTGGKVYINGEYIRSGTVSTNKIESARNSTTNVKVGSTSDGLSGFGFTSSGKQLFDLVRFVDNGVGLRNTGRYFLEAVQYYSGDSIGRPYILITPPQSTQSDNIGYPRLSLANGSHITLALAEDVYIQLSGSNFYCRCGSKGFGYIGGKFHDGLTFS